MLRLAFLPAFVFVLALASAASATTIVINPNRIPGVLPSTPSSPPVAEPIRISLGINTFVPTPASGDPDQVLKAQEAGRRMVYESAAHECDVLRATIAKDCTIESININVQHVAANQNFAQGRVDGYNVNGNVNFRISAKEPAAINP